MTGYLYHGSDMDAADLKDMECQAGPESDPREGKEFNLAYGPTGIIIAECKKCKACYKLIPGSYNIEVIKQLPGKKAR